MATKDKKPAAKKAETSTTVTRIKASSAKTTTKETPVKAADKKAPKTTPDTAKKSGNVFKSIGGYFAGAWYELKQVNWPNRKSTWSLTAAMLAFTGFFVVIILLLDALFKYLFQIMLG